MKPIFIVVLFSFCTKVVAQTSPKYVSPERIIFTQKAEQYKKMKVAGIILAVVGGVMLPVGVSKVEDAQKAGACFCSAPPYGSPQPSASDQQNLRTGILLTVAGGAFIGTGITLGTIGAIKQRSYEKRIEGLGLNELERYQRRKVMGIVMAVAGGVLFPIGLAKDQDAIRSGSGSATGDILMLGGGALLAMGIPLFISGVKNEKRYHRRVDGLTLNLKFSPQQTGLMLAYKF